MGTVMATLRPMGSGTLVTSTRVADVLASGSPDDPDMRLTSQAGRPSRPPPSVDPPRVRPQWPQLIAGPCAGVLRAAFCPPLRPEIRPT